jgi:DNA-binding GntR family transcriptional regulator
MSTVERVHDHLLGALLRGDLAPGTFLRQDEVAAELGVSKIPVREALQRLQSDGLVVFETNRGARVRALTADSAAEIFALRRSIEPLLLARSIPRMTVVDLAEVELALTESETGTAPVAESNWWIHAALYRAAGWERGLAIIHRLHAAVGPYVAMYTEQLAGSERSAREHRGLLRAARAGRVDRAVPLLERHLDAAATALVSRLADGS